MKTKEQSLAISDNTTLNTSGLMTIDLSQPLPDLDTAKALAIDLMSDYWTPEGPNESKRVFFVKIGFSPVVDINDPDVTHNLACAYFLEKTAKGEIRQIRNGSKRLVGALETVLEQGQIGQGTPMLITYLGKKQNRSNAFKSDNWSIKPLSLNIG